MTLPWEIRARGICMPARDERCMPERYMSERYMPAINICPPVISAEISLGKRPRL